MKKLLVVTLLSTLFISCKEEEIVPIPKTIKTSTISTTTTTPTVHYGIIIKNTHPTKTITGLVIDGKLQKLDSGTYPIGSNQNGYAKFHDPICSTVEFTKGCTTVTSVTYGGTGNFNSIKINRYKYGRIFNTIDGNGGSDNGINFIWNGTTNNSSTICVNWGGQRVRPSCDIWDDTIEIIAN